MKAAQIPLLATEKQDHELMCYSEPVHSQIPHTGFIDPEKGAELIMDTSWGCLPEHQCSP